MKQLLVIFCSFSDEHLSFFIRSLEFDVAHEQRRGDEVRMGQPRVERDGLRRPGGCPATPHERERVGSATLLACAATPAAAAASVVAAPTAVDGASGGGRHGSAQRSPNRQTFSRCAGFVRDWSGFNGK